MTSRKDLTRWNRAGLSRFRYVDGNAAEYLELIRQELVKRFADPKTGACDWLNPKEAVPSNEKPEANESAMKRQERLSRRQDRILRMYHQERRDFGFEISRTFARACHILTEHADAYANEGYLGTATEWENVRRLVDMLDYHPAPPASASTRLVLTAKDGQTGAVAKGFQVKYSPPLGNKIIFETLDDITIDAGLNTLRPKGFDQSESPSLSSDKKVPVSQGQTLPPLANEPAISIQGVGPGYAKTLNAWKQRQQLKSVLSKIGQKKKAGSLSSSTTCKIKDFIDLDPNTTDIAISATWLWEWKARCDIILDFAPKGDWSSLMTRYLPDIAASTSKTLAERSGNTEDQAEDLKNDIAKIALCLDKSVYVKTRLKSLFAPTRQKTGSVETAWYAEKKPKVSVDDVAMVYRERTDEAEAVTIADIDEESQRIDVSPGPVYTWYDWTKSEALLKVAPRWMRACWLNGSDGDDDASSGDEQDDTDANTEVLRTVDPHGLSADAYVGWKKDKTWRFAKIVEADKRSLRIETPWPVPEPGTKLYVPQNFGTPEAGDAVPADLAAFGAATEDPLGALDDVFLNVDAASSDLFTLAEPDSSEDGGNVPPLMPPGGLDFGSFLFPSPMLPIDLVKAAVKLALSMGIMIIPSSGVHIFKFMAPDELDTAAAAIVSKVDDALAKLGGVGWNVVPDEGETYVDLVKKLLQPPDNASLPIYKEVSAALADQLQQLDAPLLGISEAPELKAVVDTSDPPFMFDGSPDKLEAGDWVVGEFTDGVRALKVSAIKAFTEGDKTASFSLDFENLTGSEGGLNNVYADFRGALSQMGAEINDTPVDPEGITLESVPESLTIGRDVMMAVGDDLTAAKIERIDGDVITLTPPPPSDCTKGALVIYGNVVSAGHGMSRPAKILGSGNAALSNQEFTLDVDNVSFTSDPTKSAGVAAAIEVAVAGAIWQQVSSLKDSTPVDPHYVTRMTEDGYVKIIFGDGQYGRRLPTGKNNIRVRFRVGAGTAGNVPAGRLEKPVTPHPFVASVSQPTAAAGGGDMEDIASLRENAPANLLALERAVSLTDFAHLAAAKSSVWQATASREIHHGGRTETVNVVIVPANGVQSQDIRETLRQQLQNHAVPGVRVTVSPFVEKRFDIAATLWIKTDTFIAEEVENAVVDAVTDYFALKKRKLGEPLYLSDVYKVVEGVTGVARSVCVLNRDAALQRIKADNKKTVVYLDTAAGSTLTVTAKEYQL